MSSSSAVLPPLKSFLSLAPDVSDSHPREQRSSFKTTALDATTSPTTSEASADHDAGDAAKRRTSSLGSDGKASSTRRFLKLSPVHWGEHQEDHKDDFHEVAVE